MPKDYLLVNDPVDIKRVKKMIQNVIRETGDTRKAALKAYEYFKEIVDSSPGEETDESKKCMVGCLKVAADSRSSAVKLFDLLVKTFDNASKKNAKDSGLGISLGDLLEDDE